MSPPRRPKALPPRKFDLAALAEITALLSASRDPDRVLELVSSSAARLFGCQKTAIFILRDEQHQRLDLIRAEGLSQAFVTWLREALQQKAGRVTAIRNDEPVLVASLKASGLAPVEISLASTEGIGASAELPLLNQGSVIGTLMLYFDRPRRFFRTDVELLKTFASQAALVIANSRLYAGIENALIRHSQQLQALKAVNRELNATLDLRRLFEVVLDRAMDYTTADSGCLHVFDGDRNRLVQAVARGYPAEVGKLSEPHFLVYRIASRVQQNGRVSLLEDVRDDPSYVDSPDRSRSLLSVPVKYESRTLGVITLEDDQPALFTDDHLGFVSQLAAQSAIAIVNARLYQSVTESHDRLQAVLNSTREGVLVIDSAGRVALANARLAEFWGMSPPDLIGQNLADLVRRPSLGLSAKLGFTTGELLELLINLSQNLDVTASKHTYHVDQPLSRFIERSGTPVVDEHQRVIGWVLVLRDVSEEKQAEETREALTGMIVHDLRAPLTTVLNGLKLIEEMFQHLDATGILQTTVEVSLRASKKMITLIDSLLDLFKTDAGKLDLDRQPRALQALAARVVEDLLPFVHQQDVSLINAVPADLPPVLIDDEKIERVLTNLLDNAVKFAPANSEVMLRATLVDSAAQPPEAGRCVLCEVLDSGPGIPEEYRDRIFDRYMQISGRAGRRRGTGLGLAFCKMTVEGHGGRIWVQNRSGGGSVFKFTLPLAGQEELK